MDDLGLVEAVDGFGESIVVRVADATHRGLDAGLRQALGVSDGDVLAASIAVVHEPASLHRPPIMESLLQSVKDEAGMRRCGATIRMSVLPHPEMLPRLTGCLSQNAPAQFILFIGLMRTRCG